jgi:type IV secretory pathway VirB2 component (pilin)
VDSDGASQALQAWDMLHGNVLLHGWWLSDVSFYTTELPEYMLVELVRGLNQDVVHIAGALTYTLVLLLAALLAKGTATGRAGLTRVLIAVGIMIAPQLGSGVKTFLSSPDHVGTSAAVLAAFLVLDRAPQRRYVPVVVSAVLGWAAVADTLVLFIGVLPVALVCLLRAGRGVWAERRWRPQWYYLALGVGSLAAGAAGVLAPRVIRAAGGFVVQSPAIRLVHSLGALPHAANIAGQGLLLLAGADFIRLGPGPLTAVVYLHLVGVIVMGLGLLVAVRRFGRDLGFVDQVLVTAVAVNLASYVFSSQAASVLTTREIAAVLPIGAVLAGRMLACRVLASRYAAAALLVVLAGYLGGLGYELTRPPVPAQNHQLTSWLAAHRLSSGLSGYWEANVVTLTSGDRVRVRPVTEAGPGLVPYNWNSSGAWYDAGSQTANFVVLTPGVVEYPGFTNAEAVLRTFGRPARVYRVGAYQVLVWHKNLLRDLPSIGSAW